MIIFLEERRFCNIIIIFRPENAVKFCNNRNFYEDKGLFYILRVDFLNEFIFRPENVTIFLEKCNSLRS